MFHGPKKTLLTQNTQFVATRKRNQAHVQKHNMHHFQIMKLASGRPVEVSAQVDVKFKLNAHEFDDVFLLLASRKSVVLGNPPFKNVILR